MLMLYVLLGSSVDGGSCVGAEPVVSQGNGDFWSSTTLTNWVLARSLVMYDKRKRTIALHNSEALGKYKLLGTQIRHGGTTYILRWMAQTARPATLSFSRKRSKEHFTKKSFGSLESMLYLKTNCPQDLV